MTDARLPDGRKIVTNYVYPPIPDRRFDWVAYPDGAEESGPAGHGHTEAEAIAELKENLDVV